MYTLQYFEKQNNQWSKADWQLIKEQTVIFAKKIMALALTRTVKKLYSFY